MEGNDMKLSTITKTFWCLVATAMVLTVASTTGCSKKVTVDTVKLEYSFQSADAATQGTVTEAIEAIDKAEYPSAVEKLKKVAADPKLTAEQKTTVNDVLQQLEKH
jgi:hypothetical protein